MRFQSPWRTAAAQPIVRASREKTLATLNAATHARPNAREATSLDELVRQPQLRSPVAHELFAHAVAIQCFEQLGPLLDERGYDLAIVLHVFCCGHWITKGQSLNSFVRVPVRGPPPSDACDPESSTFTAARAENTAGFEYRDTP